MKAPISWLKDFVEIDLSPKELADSLVNIGLEVEEIICQGENIKNVVVGKIIKMDKHENADTLQICQVDVGEKNGGIIQIVTGATNVFEGALVPACLVGAELPTGLKIKKGKLRGVESLGMLCSGSELEITESDYEGAEDDGILILKEDAQIGDEIQKVLGLDEVILDIGVTANRPDCQSILGIAREIAAMLGKEFKEADTSFEEFKQKTTKEVVSVKVENGDLCKRYMAKAIDEVVIKPSPTWMQKRLKAVGLRPINNIVDITNYVLIEMGQPMHAFDLNQIGGGEIVVRNAKENEKIVLLDEREIELTNQLVIADSEKPMAIAGIMGGLGSGIKDCDSVVFECAKFRRDYIRKTSKAINVRTDSSAMYEKGVNFTNVETSLKRALNLVYVTGSGRILGTIYDLKSESNKAREIVYSPEKIDDILGIVIDRQKMIDILNSLNIATTEQDGMFKSIIPPYREDMEGVHDVAEEIIRFYGYDHITGTLLKEGKITNGGYDESQKLTNNLKSTLVQQGFCEAITYSFVNPKFKDILQIEEGDRRFQTIKILNPIREDLSVMRTTLCFSMLEQLSSNYKKKNEEVALFEIASVYLINGNETAPHLEVESLMIGEYSKDKDFFDLKGTVENIFETLGVSFEIARSTSPILHPGKSADIFVKGEKVGYFGEINPQAFKSLDLPKNVLVCEIMLQGVKELSDLTKKYSTIGKYPRVERDLCFLLDESVQMASVVKIIEECGKSLLESCNLFDIYKGDQIGKGKMSMAFNLKLRSVERTLTDDEIDKITSKIIKRVEKELDGSLRSI